MKYKVQLLIVDVAVTLAEYNFFYCFKKNNKLRKQLENFEYTSRMRFTVRSAARAGLACKFPRSNSLRGGGVASEGGQVLIIR